MTPEKREQITQRERQARQARKAQMDPVILRTPEPYLIAIDPGRATGYAGFVNGFLVLAGVCSQTKTTEPDALYWRCIPRFDRCTSLLVVIEKPQIYPTPQQKGDSNDLLTLAINVGELKHHYELRGAIVELVTPRLWKGQVPKPVHHARILANLTEKERAIIPTFAKSQEHNMLDAIGLGLWLLETKEMRKCHANLLP